VGSDSGGHALAVSSVLVAVPKTGGALAFADLGRRSPNAPVSVALTLRYNNQAELDQFVADVSDPHASSHGRYLTKEQFNARYAPTVEQEQSVVRGLQAAGFTVTQRFSNRTIVDATAPSATVERFFSTEMHTVRQPAYGERYANVVAASVPNSIAAYVRNASLSNVVVARTTLDHANGPGRIPLASAASTPLVAGKTIVNGNFASGSLSPGWINESTTSHNAATVTTARAFESTFSALTGSLGGPEINGWSAIAQEVIVPANGALSFWVYQGSNEATVRGGATHAWQSGYFTDLNGNVLNTFYTSVNNTNGWVNHTVNLGAFAGKTGYIAFGCFGDGNAGTYVYQYIDDVAWVTQASPTPTPKPSATPTPKPTATPVPTATPKATATPVPTATPKATATPVPTATPKATATPVPTATPIPTATPTPVPAGCNGAPPLNGPLTNTFGTLATGVAKPFDYPVQHGCNGAGYTAAVVIDQPVSLINLKFYLAGAQVTETGTVTNEAVDGGGDVGDLETDLDVQTIAGLAPGANIIVYDLGTFTTQSIADAYNQILSDGKASVVNSSFATCETSDVALEDTSNAIAEQGAAEGVTFVAATGDTGSGECPGIGVATPSGDPYFTAAGGIDFTDDANGVLQTVTMGALNGSSGGGGVSTLVPLPTWQSGIPGVITSGRNQPDISLPFQPMAVYTGENNGSFLMTRGTSWSSPAAVALFIEASQLHGSRVGWVNPTLYGLFRSTGYTTYFTPCTSGTNGAYSCTATQYNQAAGIGAPKGWALAKAL
jgi:hypothetical protein